jgi:hypothetical protein
VCDNVLELFAQDVECIGWWCTYKHSGTAECRLSDIGFVGVCPHG